MIDIQDFRTRALHLVCNAPAEMVLAGLKEMIEGDHRYVVKHEKSAAGVLTIGVMYEEFKNFWGASRVFEYSTETFPAVGVACLTMKESFQIHVPIIWN